MSLLTVQNITVYFPVQKISPDSKDKVQLQVVMHDGSASTFQFANQKGRPAQQADRDSVKELLQQLLPQFKRKVSSELEVKNRWDVRMSRFLSRPLPPIFSCFCFCCLVLLLFPLLCCLPPPSPSLFFPSPLSFLFLFLIFFFFSPFSIFFAVWWLHQIFSPRSITDKCFLLVC